MKWCDYCGRESPIESTHCVECGTLLSTRVKAVVHSAPQAPAIISAEAFDSFLEYADGFHRVDAAALSKWIAKNVPPEKKPVAWRDSALNFARKLREDLGGSYQVTSSPHAALLSAEPQQTTDWIHDYIRRTTRSIGKQLEELAWQGECPITLFLTFFDEDDYFDYVAHYCAEGVQAASVGMCIQGGFPHIAFLMRTQYEAAHIITHEMVHDAIRHLRMPLWLNEGLAQIIERSIVLYTTQPYITAELADEHHAFWNKENIQAFWAGITFRMPDGVSSLSYNLAELLLSLIVQRHQKDDIKGFIANASYTDAGQTAALDYLQTDLGELAATFLGEGSWRPQRKFIADAFRKKAKS